MISFQIQYSQKRIKPIFKAALNTTILRIGNIRITDRAKIAKALNRRNYLIYMVVIVFIAIDIDLFSAQPKFLKTEGFFWKGMAIVFQLLFILSVIKWDAKKKKIIDILHNGMIVKGELKFSERIRPNKTSVFYVHLFEYEANGQTHEVSFKNKSKAINSYYIVYNLKDPNSAVVYEDLKPNIKQLISESL